MQRRSLLRSIVTACLIGGFLGSAVSAQAGVRSSTQVRYYNVGGTTSKQLVNYMRRHPIRGDYGNAIANIRPSYRLSVPTKSSGGKCRPTNVNLSIRFVMTIPRSRNTSSMASSTRNAWRSFASYAKRHEETHKRIYIQCGNNFVAKAKKMSASSCGALQAAIRRQLEKDKRACESRQRAFDRRERSRVRNLSLFRMAR